MPLTTGAGVVIASGLTRGQADRCVRSQLHAPMRTQILVVVGQRYHADPGDAACPRLDGVRYWGSIGLVWGALAGFWIGFPFLGHGPDAIACRSPDVCAWGARILLGALLLGGMGGMLAALFRLGCPPASGAARDGAFTRSEFQVLVRMSPPASTGAAGATT